MTKAGQDKDKQANRVSEDFAPGQTSSADLHQDMSALTDWLSKMPMMQHPVAAFAAATAVGFGVTSHLAGIMLGAMQGMSDAAKRGPAEAPAEAAPTAAEAADAVVEAALDGVNGPSVASEAVETKVDRAEPEPLEATPPTPAAKSVKPRATASKPAAPRRSRTKAADDLKLISGIGPKLEQVLNGLGVTRFAEIAAWSEDDVQRVDAQLGISGRILRDGWVEQARTLMKN